MIVDLYQCPICFQLVEKIFRINYLDRDEREYACGKCFKPETTIHPQLSTQIVPAAPIPEVASGSEIDINEVKELIKTKATHLGLEPESWYQQKFGTTLSRAKDLKKLDRANEDLAIRIEQKRALAPKT